MTFVDVLDPNGFARTGGTVDVREAWREGLWIGAFNLWITQVDDGTPYILYQQRALDASWAAGCLDVAAGGYYEAGETLHDGLREVTEELGRTYLPSDIRLLGRKIYVADLGDRKMRNVIDVFITRDDSPLSAYSLQESELAGLYRCPLSELIGLHEGQVDSFVASGIKIANGRQSQSAMPVSLASFPYNWDEYHRKMVYMCRRFLQGDEPLIY